MSDEMSPEQVRAGLLKILDEQIPIWRAEAEEAKRRQARSAGRASELYMEVRALREFRAGVLREVEPTETATDADIIIAVRRLRHQAATTHAEDLTDQLSAIDDALIEAGAHDLDSSPKSTALTQIEALSAERRRLEAEQSECVQRGEEAEREVEELSAKLAAAEQRATTAEANLECLTTGNGVERLQRKAAKAEAERQAAVERAERLESQMQCRTELNARIRTLEAELAALRAPVGNAEAWARLMWESVPGRGAWGALRPELRRDWAVSVMAVLALYHAALVAAATSEEVAWRPDVMQAYEGPAAGRDERVLAARLDYARGVVAPGVGEPSQSNPVMCNECGTLMRGARHACVPRPAPKLASREEMADAIFFAWCGEHALAGSPGHRSALRAADAVLALHPDTAELVRERDEARDALITERAALRTASSDARELAKERDEARARNVELEAEAARQGEYAFAAKAEVNGLRASLEVVRQDRAQAMAQRDAADLVVSDLRGALESLKSPPLPVTVEALVAAYGRDAVNGQIATSPSDHRTDLSAVAHLTVAAIRAGAAAITEAEVDATYGPLITRDGTEAETDRTDLCAWYLDTAIERAGLAERDAKPTQFELPKFGRGDEPLRDVDHKFIDALLEIEAELRRLGGGR